MERFKYIPIHPILFAFFPTLFLLSKNIGEITLNQIGQPLMLSLILTILVWVLVNFIIQSRKISAISTSVLMLMFFSYSYVDRFFFWFHYPVSVLSFSNGGFSFFHHHKVCKNTKEDYKSHLNFKYHIFCYINLSFSQYNLP